MSPPGVRGAVGIQWLGQSGFVLAAGGIRVAVDPWLSPHELRTSAPPTLESLPPTVDWLLASHEHADHLDLPALPGLIDQYPGMVVVVPEPLAATVRAAAPGASVMGVQPGDTIAAGGTTIHAVRAWHGVTVADGYSDGFDLRSDRLTPFVGYVIRFPEATFYHGGDTVSGAGMIEELARLNIDVAMLPINGRDAAREASGILGNLDASEAVDVAEGSGARVLIPMHFDMVRGNTAPPGRAVDIASERGIAVMVPARDRELFLA